MNPKLKKLLVTTLILAIMLPITALVNITRAEPANAMWIEPSALSFNTATTNVGDTFIVTVWANTSEATYVWQCKMYWNTAHLNLTDVGYTGVGKSLFFDGHATVPVVPSVDYIGGSVTHGESLVGSDEVPANMDSLFWVEFEIISAPGKGGVLNSNLDINNADTYFLDPLLGELTTTKYGASYTYTWSTPPAPHLAIVNATGGSWIVYGQYTNATDPAFKDFSVDVMIMGLSAAWYCHNASLSVDYDPALIGLTSVVVDPLWTGPNFVGVVPGTIDIIVRNPSVTPSGDVLIATLNFEVLFQLIAPPAPIPPALGSWNDTAIDIRDYELWDTTIMIPTDPEVDGYVKVNAYVILQLAYLEVSSVTMGPEPCRGEIFNVTVSLKNLDYRWWLVGIEFRLAYDPFFIQPVGTIEGPFLPSYAPYHNDLPPPGTFYQCYFEPGPPDGPHVLCGELIYPNATGWWNTVEDEAFWPGGEGVISIIQFEVMYQSYGEPNMTSPLTIIDQLAVGLDNTVSQNIVGIPLDVPVNGNYTITTNLPGRQIDLMGGAMNRGYGSHPFPPPYGGQGPNNPMDLAIPQAEVCLCAYVSYNYWPMQNKLVGFEVEDPYGGILLKRTAATDTEGWACICFEMPWPCDDPESLFGVWKATATVDISDTRINDTMEWHYDYMVNIWKVTTDMYEYNHCDEVVITVEYGTHAQQWYPALFSVLIMDELIVPVGMALVETEIGGAEFCRYTNGTFTVAIHIPKHAAAGIATIHVNAFDRDPTEGGVAWTPEFEPLPIIAIQPY
jgi:hypothetical protein